MIGAQPAGFNTARKGQEKQLNLAYLLPNADNGFRDGSFSLDN
jgi:hypothetical protein